MLVTPCSPADLADFLVTTKLTVRYGAYARLLVQVTAGQAWAVHAVSDQSSPLAVAGLFAWDDGRESEAWFLVDRARAAASLPAALSALRQVLRAQAPRHRQGILTRVEPGNRAGETIARFLGFAPAGGGIWRFGLERNSRRAVRIEQPGEGPQKAGARAQAR